MPLMGEPDPRTLQPGDAFGEYLIDEPLGQGGMGIVFRAIREDGAVVALKVLKPGLVADENATRRFAREARAAAEVVHPHLIDVLEAGDVDGTGYLAMRYVAGSSLDDRIRARGPLPVADTVRVAAEIAAALDALHAAGFVHRDVKPSNILLDAERGALLTDFGLAKRKDYSMLTSPGQMLGTLDYIAPELLRGGEPGPHADLYALGCVVFECLAGTPPFGGRNVFEVGMAHLGDPPGDPCEGRDDAAPALSHAVLAALAKRPEERPPSATAYAELLLAAVRPG
ncbi:MAG: serine/threonine-protein kinase [Solirubrobacteraceae bacterium]